MDLSTYWAFWQRYKTKSTQLLLLVIIFIFGWQLGKTSSPYYQASPIIFEDKACERASGTVEDLTAQTAVDSNVENKTAVNTDPPLAVDNTATAPATSPQVAGASERAPVNNQPYVGSINSDLFHDVSCPASKRIKATNQIWFATIEDAKQAGYSPSKCTQEKLGL